MIYEGLFGLLFAVLEWVFPLLPDVTWSVDSGALSYFVGLLKVVFYLLPMHTVGSIIGIIVSIMTFRIVVSLIRTVCDVLPVF